MPVYDAYMPVIAAAAVNIVVSMAWYSDSLFGPMWKKLGGKSSSSKDLYQNLAMHAIAAIITATALFIAIVIFQKTQTGIYAKEGFGKMFAMFLEDGAHNTTLMSALRTAGFLWLGFLAPSKATCTIWSAGNWTKFMIDTGCQLVGLLAMAATIASLH